MPRFLGLRSLTTVARNVFRKIVAACESRGIENRAANHNRNAGHFYRKSIFLIRKNLLVLEILLQREAASHDGGEFGIIHDIAAGVAGEVFFHDFFPNPANAGGNACKSCGVHDCFHKLVVRHVDINEKLFFQFIDKLHTSGTRRHHKALGIFHTGPYIGAHRHHNVLGNLRTRP